MVQDSTKHDVATVIGGSNLDILGRSFSSFIPEDSNPGTLRFSSGGVGRNIAHNLALLGISVQFCSAFSQDVFGNRLREELNRLGIDSSRSAVSSEFPTSSYVALCDKTGEMCAAVSDMQILDCIDTAYIRRELSYINRGTLCFADPNLPAETLRHLAASLKVPLFSDPVSTTKASKLRQILPAIHTLKPNRLEAEVLSGITITDVPSALRAANVLLDAGVSRVCISLGADGLLMAEADACLHVPAPELVVANTTGAGDSAMAALIWAYLHDFDLGATGRAAVAAASITVASPHTVTETMSSDLLLDYMDHLHVKEL